MTDSDRSDDIQEVDVPLGKYDMDHLSEGMPVYKPAGEDTRLVLYFDEFQEWNRVPIGVLEDLPDEWDDEYDGRTPAEIVNGGHQMRAKGMYQCATELRETIADYTDE